MANDEADTIKGMLQALEHTLEALDPCQCSGHTTDRGAEERQAAVAENARLLHRTIRDAHQTTRAHENGDRAVVEAARREATLILKKPIRRKRIGKGVYRDAYGIAATVKVGTGDGAQQREKRFPFDTKLTTIREWQDAMRAELRTAQRRPSAMSRGTLERTRRCIWRR